VKDVLDQIGGVTDGRDDGAAAVAVESTPVSREELPMTVISETVLSPPPLSSTTRVVATDATFVDRGVRVAVEVVAGVGAADAVDGGVVYVGVDKSPLRGERVYPSRNHLHLRRYPQCRP
jgi:hypothetical protein